MKGKLKIGILVLVLGLAAYVIYGEFSITGDVVNEPADEEALRKLFLDFMYENDYCYDGMEEEGMDECGDVDGLHIGIFNSAEYEFYDALVLISRLAGKMQAEYPELHDEELFFDFVNKEKIIVDTFTIKDGRWSNGRQGGMLTSTRETKPE